MIVVKPNLAACLGSCYQSVHSIIIIRIQVFWYNRKGRRPMSDIVIQVVAYLQFEVSIYDIQTIKDL